MMFHFLINIYFGTEKKMKNHFSRLKFRCFVLLTLDGIRIYVYCILYNTHNAFPVYNTHNVYPIYNTHNVYPVYNTHNVCPVYNTHNVYPVYNTPNAFPVHKTHNTSCTHYTQHITKHTRPVPANAYS